jgi:hypothetical protein
LELFGTGQAALVGACWIISAVSAPPIVAELLPSATAKISTSRSRAILLSILVIMVGLHVPRRRRWRAISPAICQMNAAQA